MSNTMSRGGEEAKEMNEQTMKRRLRKKERIKGERVVDGKVKKMNSKSQTRVNIRFQLAVFVINQQSHGLTIPRRNWSE